ncbi:hypothetical protein [Chondromyces apiculatus]|uniref:Uncharacterized protein n=1 Tax=Chondromyces apiculatus DSM 436 TaxID=1192034 RepID=A0A017THQ0_9BACT|nr:hypothetical protein [Chondromyces apiculatus]EYF08779.1 Hypothetical protein CAP_2640 [Chondromyces apiculatus DSM 436]
MSQISPPSPPSTPRVDYGEAARRHHHDAEMLFTAGRRGNADHLYGIAAECALLGILRTSPTAAGLFNADGALKDRERRKHIDVLWTQFCKEAAGFRLGTAVGRLKEAYPAKAQPSKSQYRAGQPGPANPFQGWSVEQRYLSEAAMATEVTDEILEKHRAAAKRCLTLLDELRPARSAGAPQ